MQTWKASDMWSIGVVVFLLVHGYPPFNDHDEDKIFAKIKRGRYRCAVAAAAATVAVAAARPLRRC
jgi:hypothetical protein